MPTRVTPSLNTLIPFEPNFFTSFWRGLLHAYELAMKLTVICNSFHCFELNLLSCYWYPLPVISLFWSMATVTSPSGRLPCFNYNRLYLWYSDEMMTNFWKRLNISAKPLESCWFLAITFIASKHLMKWKTNKTNWHDLNTKIQIVFINLPELAEPCSAHYHIICLDIFNTFVSELPNGKASIS